jgi:putative ABC transport system substrate-binding protein
VKLALILVIAVLFAPLPADAQQAGRLHRIGVLSHDSFPPALLESFRGGLRELGYVEGRTLAFEMRHADGKIERVADLAEELVRLKVDVIFAIHTPAALAAKKATTAIPIVVTRVADPVKTGLVSNISRPGGNITGLSFIPELLSGKRLELLREALPGIRRVAVLWTADNPGATEVAMAMEPASARLGLQLLKTPVRSHGDFGAAVEGAKRDGAGALIVTDDAFVTRHRVELVKLAAKHSMPVFSLFEPVAEAGGLMAYGPSTPDMYRRAAYYVDRILKGEKPGDLPIEQPTRFHLVVNVKAAKALGLAIPAALQLRADRLID